jgi:hypothetical protein
MKRVVISQPMYFPWVGMFEQIRLADVYVHYDDVQFARGFMNRVQAKTADGWMWLTVPRVDASRGQLLKDIAVKDDEGWQRSHLTILEQAYKGAPHRDEMLELARSVLGLGVEMLADLAIASMDSCCEYFGLAPAQRFARSSELGIEGRGWSRLLAIVKRLGGDVYVTGHGARNYLDHEAFEREGVRVEYMDYRMRPYPQLHGEFNPYVSILDLVANRGRDGREVICSGTVPWREFLAKV